jgi:4-hydroxybenzoate polyprenyltransferase
VKILSPLYRLMRLDKPVGIWLVFFPAGWAVLLASCAETGMRWDVLVVCALGAVITRSFGCIINDLTDRKLDAHVARTRTRPLASEELSPRIAIIAAIILALLALILVLLLPPMALYVACLAVPMILVYPWMKRVTWWPQIFLGLTFNLGALIGWVGVTGTIDLPALWLYAASVVWTFGYDTLYAHQDREDDSRLGIKSSALALGNDTVRVVGYAYAVTIACLMMAGLGASAQLVYWLALVASAAQFCTQLLRFRLNNPQIAGRLFRSNIQVGLIMLTGAFFAHPAKLLFPVL